MFTAAGLENFPNENLATGANSEMDSAIVPYWQRILADIHELTATANTDASDLPVPGTGLTPARGSGPELLD